MLHTTYISNENLIKIVKKTNIYGPLKQIIPDQTIVLNWHYVVKIKARHLITVITVSIFGLKQTKPDQLSKRIMCGLHEIKGCCLITVFISLSHPCNMIGCFLLKPHPLFKWYFDLAAAHASVWDFSKILLNCSLSVRMLNRQEVKCWPTARLHEELDYVLWWLRWHIAFD